MFLHLGGNIAILNQEVVAILNYKTFKKNSASQTAFGSAKKTRTINPDKEIKSVILTQEEIYFSPISSWTLLKRADFSDMFKGETYVQRV